MMTRQQCTHRILMIRPAKFGFNEMTAENNVFQNQLGLDNAQIKKQVLEEFDQSVLALRSAGIEVTVVTDTEQPAKPDAIFPNNWFSTHQGGHYALYGMYAPNRRLERRADVVQMLVDKWQLREIMDLSSYEKDNKFLEGTGSLILDRQNRVAYACRSQRTDDSLFELFCQKMGYEGIIFDSQDANGHPVYHTNVIMAMGEDEVVICLESIVNVDELAIFLSRLRSTNKLIIDVSHEQVLKFAGNMLQVRNEKGQLFWVMSTNARESLTDAQWHNLTIRSEAIVVDIPTIEAIGGGGIRCMMAEIFE